MDNGTDQKNNPGIIVLQWLTYAFWGWTVLAVSVLAINVIAYLIAPEGSYELTAYASAAVLVLLPISATCDIFYSKKEPQHKTGIASVIMIVHTVIFALFSISALIAIVFSLVQFVVSSSDLTGTKIALYSEIIVAILFSLTFFRTLMPIKLLKLRKLFPIIMTIIIGVISVLGFIGPVANTQLTRDDRLIDNNLSNIQTGIDSYVSTSSKLPSNLNELNMSGDTKTLIDKNLVQYVPNSKPAVVTPNTFEPKSSTNTYYYELCVDYKKAVNGSNPYTQSYPSTSISSDGYYNYVNTPVSSHPAGNYCFKLSSSPIY